MLWSAAFWWSRNHARTALSKCAVECSATSSPTSAKTASAPADTTAMRVQNVISFRNQSRTRRAWPDCVACEVTLAKVRSNEVPDSVPGEILRVSYVTVRIWLRMPET